MSQTGLYSTILNAAGSLVEGIGDYYEGEHVDDYNARAAAWERMKERIENENKMRSERVRRRNEIMNQMGGGWESRAPQMEKAQGGMLPYHTSDTADWLKTGSNILTGVADLMSGSDSGSIFENEEPNESTSMGSTTSGIDINTQSENPSTTMASTYDPKESYAYTSRYDPNKRYLTAQTA